MRPIKLISGSSPFCETHFENVRVPKKNVVHKVNAGWTVAKALLGHERTMVAEAFGSGGGAGGKRGTLGERAKHHLGSENGRLADPVLRDQLAQLEMDTRAFALTMQRAKDAAKAGHQPGPESSIFKVYGTEVNMRRQELLVRIAGPQGLGWEGPGFDPEELGHHAGLAALARQLDRGRHLRGAAQRDREARARPAGLRRSKRWSSFSPKTRS